jgi:hypothetical protein
MFIGDDDCVEKDYLLEVRREIERRGPTVIVPAVRAMTEDWQELDDGRDLHLTDRRFDQGFEACLELAWRGHQMSGLMFRTDTARDGLREAQAINWYLFIFLVGHACLQGMSAHLTCWPVRVMRPPQAKKTFNYGEDGLIGDVFDNFVKLAGISQLQRSKLELKFLYKQYWRYAMYLKLGPRAFVTAIRRISTGSNTTRLTGLAFPALCGPFLFANGLNLLARGQLFHTLGRKVEL